MASLNQDDKGHFVIFRDPDTQKQRKMRLGAKVSKKTAGEILNRMEYLIVARASKTAPDADTASGWLALANHCGRNFTGPG